MKIKAGHSFYEVITSTVGVNFGTIAKVRIAGKAFESPSVPLGNMAAAGIRLLDAVRRDYPTAELHY